MARKRNLDKKLTGYQKMYRNRFFLLKDKLLTPQEFLVYELCIAMTDWDQSHQDTYGTFILTNMEIATYLGWKEDSSAYRHRNSLKQKGYLISREDGREYAKDFMGWCANKSPAKLQDEVAYKQDTPAQTQNFSGQSMKSLYVSSRGSVNKNTSSSAFGQKDVAWIDENVKEDPKLEFQSILKKLKEFPDSEPIDNLSAHELHVLATDLFGENTRVTENNEVWG